MTEYNHNPYGGYPSKHIEKRKQKENETPTGTIPELTKWVGSDKERAQRVIDNESTHPEPRKSLLKTLEKIVNDN